MYSIEITDKEQIEKLFTILSNNNQINVTIQIQGNTESEKHNIAENEITKLLYNFNIHSNLLGYGYLQEALKIFVDNKGPVPMTTVVYKQVADKFKTTPSRVERAIRHSIGKAYSNNFGCLGNKIRKFSSRPTNSEFIAIAYQILESGVESCQEI